MFCARGKGKGERKLVRMGWGDGLREDFVT